MATTVPFPDLPRTPRGHLSLRFYEAVLALATYGEERARSAGASPESMVEAHPFLGVYLRELDGALPGAPSRAEALSRFRERAAAWERATSARLPLRTLTTELGLDEAHVLALLLIGLVEEDPRFGDVFAAALGGRPVRRPTVGLLHQVVAAAAVDVRADPWALARPLVDAGLVAVIDAGEPRADWQLRVPVELWAALAGEVSTSPLPGVRWRPAEGWEPLSEMVLEDAQRGRLVEARGVLASGDAALLVVRGLPGSERLEAVGAVARALGRGVLEAGRPPAGVADPWRLLGPLATLARALPAFVLELAPGETFEVPEWPGYHGPVGVVLGHDGGIGGPVTERSVTLELPPEPPALRRRHWERALPGADSGTHTKLAGTVTLGGRYIRRAAALARAQAALEGRTRVAPGDVRAAARSINRQQLDTLATRVEEGGGWERLVLHPSTASELHHLERRCRHRERLTRELADGMPGGLNRGVRALFQGPSGTGKTLAARVLAAELGLDLYRVDLSAVISKYIGETEKNLSRVLGRAEDLDVLLLLDEGDSLMGRRTEVRSAHDRWANLETNYLLQRLDGYSGIVVVTTNLPGSVDSAFQRRMDAVVRFHAPTFEERWHLWQQHLPPGHGIEPDVLEAVALRYELTGGQIRNAAIDAALLGFVAPDGRTRADDLATAVEAEYRKAGAAAPRDAAPPAADDGDDAMSAFLGAIR